MAQEQDPTLALTTPFLLTPTYHRQPYPYISATSPSNAQPGKLVFITGAGSGIGAATARVWAQAGAAGIVLAGRTISKLETVKNELHGINASAQVLTVAVDVAIDDDMARLHARTKETFGRPADVLVLCAGADVQSGKVGEVAVGTWWSAFELNTRGLYSLVHHWIRSQPDPAAPTGTLVYVSGGLETLVYVGMSALSVSNLAVHRLVEFIQSEYPTLRAFTLLPGLVQTDRVAGSFMEKLALDHVDLTGLFSLWLAQPKADFMKGRLININWDLEELEKHAEEIEKGGMLTIKPAPDLPVNGGKIFGT